MSDAMCKTYRLHGSTAFFPLLIHQVIPLTQTYRIDCWVHLDVLWHQILWLSVSDTRTRFYVIGVIQISALIGESCSFSGLTTVELISPNWIQFTFGRIIALVSRRMQRATHVDEIAPASMRRMLAGTVQVITSAGNLWGAGTSRSYSTETKNIGVIIQLYSLLTCSG